MSRISSSGLPKKDEFAGIVGRILEFDSIQIIRKLNDNEYLNSYGFNTDNVLTMFIPNTYEFYWNTSVEQFFARMQKEYSNFWDSTRLDKAKEKNLTQIEVSILASIIQKESNKRDEWKRIAGVYLNRLEKGMLLQADPTITYLYRGKTIKRVLKYQHSYTTGLKDIFFHNTRCFQFLLWPWPLFSQLFQVSA